MSKLPIWLRAEMTVVAQPHYGKAGRPAADAEKVAYQLEDHAKRTD